MTELRLQENTFSVTDSMVANELLSWDDLSHATQVRMIKIMRYYTSSQIISMGRLYAYGHGVKKTKRKQFIGSEWQPI
jgi:hypothetical protein